MDIMEMEYWSLLRKALIRAGKTSYTAGTLCAIAFEMVDKIIKIIIIKQ
jgi:hypothetical protein